MSTVKPIPDGCNSVNAYLVLKDVNKAIEFYQKAFGGTGGACMTTPDGKSVVHAEVKIGNSTIMLSEENPEWGMTSAETMGGSPVSLHLYVEDVDGVFARAIKAGCTEIAPLMDAFWGDRYGKLVDPFGYQWGIATHIEDVSDEEVKKRGEKWFAEMANAGGSSA